MYLTWTFQPLAVRGLKAIGCFLLATTLAGCSSSSATVNGKVTVNGKEVTEGTLVFAPLGTDGNPFPGKPGLAGIGADGSYSLELKAGPNGLASRCNVSFTPAPIQTTSKSKNVVILYQGLFPKQTSVEVKPGSNIIDIELIPTPSGK